MEKVISIVKKSDTQSDFQYWQTKTIRERIDAIEILRFQYIEMNKNVQPGLQRVYTVVKQKSG